jgi:hypothetical protein
MDDLDVIRLAVIDNIAEGRIARARVEVKENFGGGRGDALSGLPDPSTAFSFVRGSGFTGETPVPSKESGHWQVRFHVRRLTRWRNLRLRKEDWNR